jgi:hypothetical protein
MRSAESRLKHQIHPIEVYVFSADPGATTGGRDGTAVLAHEGAFA